MTKEDYEKLRATMPWTERTVHTRTGGLVQIIDNQGQEVPLFTITAFLDMITRMIANKPAQKEAENAQTTAAN